MVGSAPMACDSDCEQSPYFEAIESLIAREFAGKVDCNPMAGQKGLGESDRVLRYSVE